MAFTFGSFAQIKGPAGGVLPDLGDGHDVQTVVELAIPGSGKPVAFDVPGRHLDGGSAGVAGKCRRGAESVDCTDTAEDLARG